MVPIPESVARQRYRDLVAQDSPGSSLFRLKLHRAPHITYGKRNASPLSLTAIQFRPDMYAIPSDDDEEINAQQDHASTFLPATEQEALAEDSGRSDDEFLPSARVFTDRKGITRSRSKQRTMQANTGRAPSTTVTSTAHSKKGTAKPVKTPRKKPVYPCEERHRTNETSAAPTKTATKQKAVRTSETKPTRTKTKTSTPARRIPIRELFLVASPLDFTHGIDPQSTYHGIQTQDPIHDPSSSPRKRRSSSSSSDDAASKSNRPKAPLSALRERFKTPKYRHKRLRGRAYGEAEHSPFEVADVEPRGRDGFEDSELAIKLTYTKVRQKHRRKNRLLLRIGALQLQNGPLPDVDFESSTTELKMEAQSENANAAYPAQIDYDDAPILPSTAPRRRVSFSDRVRENLIRAQLSSISAPERIPSESDDSDEEDDEEIDDGVGDLEDESGVDDSDLLGNDDQTTRSSSVQIINEQVAKNSDRRSLDQHVEQPKQRNLGVTLDFRQAAIPGQLPRQPLGRRSLIEVNEAIVEVPESHRPTGDYPLDVMGARAPSRDIMEQPDRPPPMRRRSILKNSTPAAIPDSTTLPEETEANTRRNSIVDTAKNRYFANATNMLDIPDSAKHTIIPRRSDYVYHMDAEVPDTGRVVPETSPEPPDCTNFSNVNVLRCNAEEQWTSKLPTVPEDLKTLTRSVSREHGTLSQSVRRRQSLPFQSPSKVR